MKIMAKAVNLPGKHTNHSARRTIITHLRHENVNPLDISQLSGHRNLKSIDSYSTVSEEQQKQISFLISNRCSDREAMKPHDMNEKNCTELYSDCKYVQSRLDIIFWCCF